MPEDVEVGALRVSVTGWDGWVLEGLRVSAQSSASKLCSNTCSVQAHWSCDFHSVPLHVLGN